LLLLALLVVFWLPGRVSDTAVVTGDPEPPSTAVAEQPTQGAAPASSAQAGPDNSPWSDAQQSRLRKAAQDVLAELLDVQFALEERGVQQWAPKRFNAATVFATAGDDLYKQREYEAATKQYQQGLDALQALQEAIPEELSRLLESARQAIEDGDREAAAQTLATAAVIEPDHPDIATLQARAEKLEQLLSLLEQADQAEASGDLAAAEALLREASSLDPQHQRVAAKLERVAEDARRQAFNDAMSEGYAQLGENHFTRARKAFRTAAGLQPGSEEAASALLEVDASETAYKLAGLQRRGRSGEEKEQWQKAADAYEQAQAIDGSVLFAVDGLKRSLSRARLDTQFRQIIDDPQRLSDVAVAKAAEELVAKARQITPSGPVLQQQIAEMDTLLRQANTPVSVTLRSDMETEVIVYKVARLGRFDQRELTLRPGTYTAVGSRNGYRDVRKNFTLRFDSGPATVTVICTEPI
jgi:tetratricopeptide (TPR) repeat protein